MGGLSADQLRQFQASGSVELQDATEGVFVAADRVTYERDREILAILGSHRQDAQIVQQRPGRSPTIWKGQRAFYNLATNQLELQGSTVGSR